MPRSQYIDAVSCTIRLFEPTPDLDQRFANSMSFRRGDGGPPQGLWSFYALLTQLFESGPGFCPKNSGRPRYVVGTITIDIVAPTDGAPHTSFGQPEEALPVGPRRGSVSYDGWRRKDGATVEESLASYLHHYIDYLLRLTHGYDRQGRFIWECVRDRIVFLVNGKELESFDMEEGSQTRVPNDWNWWGTSSEFDGRKRDWDVWRAWLMERRRRMRDGLEVEDDSPALGPRNSIPPPPPYVTPLPVLDG